MAYKCPRCGGPVSRYRGRGRLFGGSPFLVVDLVGAMLRAAFSRLSPLECRNCGQIPTEEFPPADRMNVSMGACALVGAAVLFLAIAVVVFIALSVSR